MIILVVGVLACMVWVALPVGGGRFWRVAERFERLNLRELNLREPAIIRAPTPMGQGA